MGGTAVSHPQPAPAWAVGGPDQEGRHDSFQHLRWHHQPTCCSKPGQRWTCPDSWGRAKLQAFFPQSLGARLLEPWCWGTACQSKCPCLMGEAEPANQRVPARRRSLPIGVPGKEPRKLSDLGGRGCALTLQGRVGYVLAAEHCVSQLPQFPWE